jgi:hypothetical protein
MNLSMGEIDDLTFEAEAGIAETRLASYITDLKAVTDANVSKIVLKVEDPGDDADSGLPGGEVDISDEAVIVCHTNDATFPAELAPLRVPAPPTGVWLNDNREEGLDKSDADVQNYVENFSANFEFSDGEHVNTGEGTSGIHDGFWRSRPRAIR